MNLKGQRNRNAIRHTYRHISVAKGIPFCHHPPSALIVLGFNLSIIAGKGVIQLRLAIIRFCPGAVNLVSISQGTAIFTDNRIESCWIHHQNRRFRHVHNRKGDNRDFRFQTFSSFHMIGKVVFAKVILFGHIGETTILIEGKFTMVRNFVKNSRQSNRTVVGVVVVGENTFRSLYRKFHIFFDLVNILGRHRQIIHRVYEHIEIDSHRINSGLRPEGHLRKAIGINNRAKRNVMRTTR